MPLPNTGVVTAAAIHINKGETTMKEFSIQNVEKVLGLKLLLLSFVIFSLTLAKPAAILVHQEAQKICSFIMQTEDCGKHC